MQRETEGWLFSRDAYVDFTNHLALLNRSVSAIKRSLLKCNEIVPHDHREAFSKG